MRIILIFMFFALSVLAEDLKNKENSLADLVAQKSAVVKTIANLETKLVEGMYKSHEDQVRQELLTLKDRLKNLDDSLVLIASGSDPKNFRETPEEKFNIENEIGQLLEPFVVQMRKITEEPRQIHSLESSIEKYKTINQEILEVIKKLTATRDNVNNQEVKDHLSEKINELGKQSEDFKSLLLVTEEKHRQLIAARKSLTESIASIFEMFFKSRAKNLFYAILFTVIFWFILRRLSLLTQRYLNLEVGGATTVVRAFNVVFLLSSSFGCILFFLFCLFVFSDWLLLLLGSLLVLGLFWASRQALPKFWQQAVLLLNVGPVREGERIVYNNIPMLVEHIRLFSVLSNPALSNSRIILPLADLSDFRSKPYNQDELWFPTKQADWVILSDQTFGQVEYQSLEYIVLRLPGGAKKIFNSADFQQLIPKVLNEGFRLSVDLGIDYENQSIADKEIPEKLKEEISEYFKLLNLYDQIYRIRVEFKLANISSLDFVVLIDFAGELASQHDDLVRMIQRSLLQACNKYAWKIPFQQIDLHIKNKDEIKNWN